MGILEPVLPGYGLREPGVGLPKVLTFSPDYDVIAVVIGPIDTGELATIAVNVFARSEHVFESRSASSVEAQIYFPCIQTQ